MLDEGSPIGVLVDVTLLPAAGCDFGGLTFSNFNVSASAGFSAATVGTGAASTATSSTVNLIYQLSSTPGVGPGDVLFSYAVTASPGIKLTGIDLTNDAIMGPVVIGEVACRVMSPRRAPARPPTGWPRW